MTFFLDILELTNWKNITCVNGTTTLSITTFSITTLSTKDLFVTISTNDTQHDNVVQCCWVSLCWLLLFIYCYDTISWYSWPNKLKNHYNICQWHHDTQHNNIQHHNTQDKGLFVTISTNDTQHDNVVPFFWVSLCWKSRFIYYLTIFLNIRDLANWKKHYNM